MLEWFGSPLMDLQLKKLLRVLLTKNEPEAKALT